MKNGDMPANPMPLDADGLVFEANDLDDLLGCKPAVGLTKREYFAVHIYVGMCAGSAEEEAWPTMGGAVDEADKLLEILGNGSG